MAKANKEIKEEKEETIDLTLIKEELKDYVDIKLKNSFNEELERSNRRLIREKNKKILFRNIVILVLLVIIGLLLYLMYTNKYFHKFFSDSKSEEVVKEEVNKEEEKEEVKEITLDDLIKKYSYLLDKVNMNEKSDYIKDYYEGNLTNELKSYLALSNIDLSKLTIEEDYNIIDTKTIEEEYNKLFSGEFDASSFSYNGVKIRFVSKLESYITDKVLESSKSNIKREIISIKVDGDKVSIECIEGIITDGKLLNVVTNKEVSSKNTDLKSHEKDLTKVTYTFNKEKLESIK